MTTTDEQFDEMRAQALAEARVAIAEKKIRANTPVRYREAKVEHQGVADWITGWLEGNPAGLLLTGPTGVGKTFQAYAALAECIRRGTHEISVLAGSVPTLLDQCRPGREPEARTMDGAFYKRDVPAEMVGSALLLLDDLGAEKPSDWTGEILYRVIDERYMNLRPTIVVSNVPPRELAATIGDRLASRLTEMCRTVAMKGDDRRRQR